VYYTQTTGFVQLRYESGKYVAFFYSTYFNKDEAI